MVNFRSKLHVALFKYYFEYPDAECYVRELSRTLSFGAAFLSRELATLTNVGIFISSTRGNHKYFRLNKKHPLHNELRAMTIYLVSKKDTKRKDAKREDTKIRERS
ncbi:MAG: hypothetical protein A2945_01945 [Candidatus Liptonbacteria bacterium RIFCSPLOWO2_01_FULL_52_25]|uniref:Uncharacterized protein n=1 Tax=Candidatus Liptonbacteria bacterium RIFCSPLOWO2_01_FULL_52_25 TaxID=1798650 RepID=A0A1G2CEB1_9BACT|nr:MAG: hypothetical protein A2945_01945 [Candidatus Liptonbacteria bacterium RIFCSPLOWO2_01_FULL_52_25]